VLVFQHLGHRPGTLWEPPLVVYLFVASIGTDYNILMTSRLREEILNGQSAPEAARQAITHAGPTVAAAGAILASSFAMLAISGGSELTQIGFSVAVGVLISAFVMAPLLVPTLTILVGPAAWWPSRTYPPKPVRSAVAAGDSQPRPNELVDIAGR
jgi:RND superfamily putative drug exporter